MTRLKANLAILKQLETFFKENPDQRFGQALLNLNILQRDEDSELIDPYWTEPTETLIEVKQNINDWKGEF